MNGGVSLAESGLRNGKGCLGRGKLEGGGLRQGLEENSRVLASNPPSSPPPLGASELPACLHMQKAQAGLLGDRIRRKAPVFF